MLRRDMEKIKMTQIEPLEIKNTLDELNTILDTEKKKKKKVVNFKT